MENRYKSVGMIENELSKLFTGGGLSEHIFIGNVPGMTDDDWLSWVVVDVLRVDDYDSWCDGSVNVFLYAKSEGGMGKKPHRLLYEMEQRLVSLLEGYRNEHYCFTIVFRDSGYEAEGDLHFNVFNISVSVM